jgi:hypothetical protein
MFLGENIENQAETKPFEHKEGTEFDFSFNVSVLKSFKFEGKRMKMNIKRRSLEK